MIIYFCKSFCNVDKKSSVSSSFVNFNALAILDKVITVEALVFKLLGRPEEGKLLTLSEIEEIGYKFQMLIKIEN